ncbi:hypothetical protein NSK_004311 [Nannochloropsis salina CCMP1776]|uniref:Vesicle transport v-SNARE N-terminal domain-containing protein n=1 Tax=Nannochloropsis salina CCMP1776 TaxID=1027361 RepID=A0A4D9CYM8_9STRA|nr:hypothetical protein NSK_004311 [Nannochloropsis salina CCMP1776]|eukprot:TFJ84320.1 hypothetical protein NSK_004311 [Nannochloropsis salina CCMP1776]
MPTEVYTGERATEAAARAVSAMDTSGQMQEEYYRLSRAINRGLNELTRGRLDGGGSISGGHDTMPLSRLLRLVAEIDLDLAEAEGQVKGLEIEVQDMPVKNKSMCREKVLQFRNDLKAMRRSFEAAKARAERHMLLQLSQVSGKRKNIAERLMSSTEQLHDARKVVDETEHIGEGIIYQMEAQREQLVRASEQVNNF